MRAVVVQQSGEWISVFIDAGREPMCVVAMDDLSEAMAAAGMMASVLKLPIEVRPEAAG